MSHWDNTDPRPYGAHAAKDLVHKRACMADGELLLRVPPCMAEAPVVTSLPAQHERQQACITAARNCRLA